MTPKDNPRESGRETTPSRFPETTPPAYPGSDYSFTLQAVMEMQKGVGHLTKAVETLEEHAKSQGQKIDHMSKVIYAAGVVLTIAVIGGGWVVNRVADVAIEMFRHSTPQTQQVPVSPQNHP
ncbi:MAG: hypothetical protein WAL71_09225 [Terriglobales bacterium]